MYEAGKIDVELVRQGTLAERLRAAGAGLGGFLTPTGLGTDLAKGKLTLPILNLLEAASESQRTKINQRILDQKELDLPVLVGIAEYDGALERAVDTATGLLSECREDLNVLQPSEYRDALRQITYFLEGLLAKCRK